MLAESCLTHSTPPGPHIVICFENEVWVVSFGECYPPERSETPPDALSPNLDSIRIHSRFNAKSRGKFAGTQHNYFVLLEELPITDLPAQPSAQTHKAPHKSRTTPHTPLAQPALTTPLRNPLAQALAQPRAGNSLDKTE